MILKDTLYGRAEVKEPVLIDLIRSEPVRRLEGVSQHGFPKGETKTNLPDYSRYEHSIGVMLLLKALDASLEEQIAGLLHDVSHTAFSHVVDWMVGDPSKSNYQDKSLAGYIRKSGIGSIVSEHGFDTERISNLESNSHFRLLERNIPDLCADRIDYALRDSLYLFGTDPRYCIKSLIVRENEIIFDSEPAARRFGQSYMACQESYWAGDEAKLRYHFLSLALKGAIAGGVISMDNMYDSEMEIVNKLKKAKNREIVCNISRGLGKLNFMRNRNGSIVLLQKLRYVDPKFLRDGEVCKLSSVDLEYRKTIEKEKEKTNQTVKVKLIE